MTLARRRRVVDRRSRPRLARRAVHPRLHGQPDVDATRRRSLRRRRVRGRAARAFPATARPSTTCSRRRGTTGRPRPRRPTNASRPRCEQGRRRRAVDGRHADRVARREPSGDRGHRRDQRRTVAPQAPEIVEMVKGMVDEGQTLMPGIGSDIAKPGVIESAYEGTPLKPLLSLIGAAEGVSERLGDVTCAVLIMTSPNDHVVDPERVRSARREGEWPCRARHARAELPRGDRRLRRRADPGASRRVREEGHGVAPAWARGDSGSSVCA